MINVSLNYQRNICARTSQSFHLYRINSISIKFKIKIKKKKNGKEVVIISVQKKWAELNTTIEITALYKTV